MQSDEAPIEACRVIPAEPDGVAPEHHTVVIADGRIGAVLPHARALPAFGAAGDDDPNDPGGFRERPLGPRGNRPMLASVPGRASNPARIDRARRRFLEPRRAGAAVRIRLCPNRFREPSKGQGARRASSPTSTHG